MQKLKISPKYMMQLIPKIEKELWDMFEVSKYKNVRRYVLKWHEEWYDFNQDYENFQIFYKDKQSKEINLAETLHNMPDDIVIKIAIDLGIDTPNLLPAVTTIKNEIKAANPNAYNNFNNAIKKVYEEPAMAVAQASSALDDVIKTIISDKDLDTKKISQNASLTKQIGALLDALGFSKETAPKEIKTIATNLRSLGTNIDNARSSQTPVHGKLSEDYVIDNPLWAVLFINTCATLGLFLWSFYKEKYTDSLKDSIDISEIPF